MKKTPLTSNVPRSLKKKCSGSPLSEKDAHELLFLNQVQNRVVFAPYTVVGDSFRADKPQVWSPTGHRNLGIFSPYDIHPNGKRLAVAAARDETGVVQDKVVFFLGFGEYLTKISPGTK